MDFVWTKFYRRAFLLEKEVHYQPLIYFEDELFNFEVFRGQPHLLMTDCNVVCYEHGNNNSSMRTVEREKVLVQLHSLLDLHERMNGYLQNHETLMKPAARCIIYNVLNHFYKKAFYICLSPKEWKECMSRLKSQPLHRMTLGKSGMEKLVDVLKNSTSDSYVNYVFLRLLHIYVIRHFVS